MELQCYHFLKSCNSKPKILQELKPGEKFIFFPDDGDDHGHGGFRGGSRLFVKIAPIFPGGIYGPTYCYSHREYERPEILGNFPPDTPVIKIHGV